MQRRDTMWLMFSKHPLDAAVSRDLRGRGQGEPRALRREDFAFAQVQDDREQAGGDVCLSKTGKSANPTQGIICLNWWAELQERPKML